MKSEGIFGLFRKKKKNEEVVIPQDKDFVSIKITKDTCDISFYIDQDVVMKIGENIEKINEQAYMNGYNWEVLLHFYLKFQMPDLLVGLATDPEADMYSASYPYTVVNEKKAQKLYSVICDFVNHPKTIYEFVKTNGNEIPWD